MDLLRPSDVRTLLEEDGGPRVSIYMPTHRGGPETRQDPIRLKNLLGQAEQRLGEIGLRSPDTREILDPAQQLLDDQDFWEHQGDGLALFLAADRGRVFRLPLAFEELVVAGDRFHVKPFIPLLTGDGRFLVLALSKNRIRLLQATRQVLAEVELEDVPSSLRETAVHREMAMLNYHVGGGFSGGGRQSAIFHGHGPEEDEELIRKYFRRIDSGIREALPGVEAPLVLAAVRREADLYREVTEYPTVLAEIVAGNPDEKTDRDLHAEARPIMEGHLEGRMREAVERFEEQPDLTIREVEDAVIAAHHGRVEVLWAALEVQRWGSFDEETASVDVHDRPKPGDHDLLDLAATQTLLNGGTVYAVASSEVPGDGPAAALLRY